MGRFVNQSTGVTFSVDDSKDERYAVDGFESADEAPAPKKAPAKRSTSAKSDK